MPKSTKKSPLRICILGCGGFIGSHLVERLLRRPSIRVTGIDIVSSKIAHLRANERFIYVNMDVNDFNGISGYIEDCDIVISLVALCNPAQYNTIPIMVIDSNFTNQLPMVKLCAQKGKWLIHFSTCEVYGRTLSAHLDADLADDPYLYEMHEDQTPLIMGPISAQRWTYACAKQLLERAIFAYGFEDDLHFTIIRPFNFIGPRMDYIPGIDGEGVPRVLACFMDALLFNKEMMLVGGGVNRRAFTYISDAIDAVMLILDRKDAAKRQIFNIGNPENEVSIEGLADLMIEIYHELLPETSADSVKKKYVSGLEFYGVGYDDSDRRVPRIDKARKLLDWEPQVNLRDALRKTMAAYILQYSAMRP